MLWLALAMVCQSAAAAQTAQDEVERLNREAMEAYHMLEVDKAGGMLEEALRIAEQSGTVTAEAVALTHLNLGVVYIGALSDEQAGLDQFTAGLCMNSAMELDPLTSTPQMKQIFDRAQSEASGGNCPAPIPTAGAGGGSAAPVPSPGQVASDYGDYGSSGPVMDDETPWDNEEHRGPATEMKKGFVQLGFAMGMTYIQPGMRADRDPPQDQIFTLIQPGQDPTVTPGTPVLDPKQTYRDIEAQVAAMDGDRNNVPRLYLPSTGQVGTSNWVPDADSEDSYLSPYSGSCPGDGKSSGPRYADAQGEGLLPTSYCVRVKAPGFVTRPALRFAAGYFVTPELSLAAIGRIQLGAGEGTLAGILLGARGEYLILPSEATGFSLSAFLGATFGQIQAKIASDDAAPWTLAGPVGAHIGMNARYRFHEHFGLVLSPEFDMLFPDLLMNIDFTLAAEAAF